jgi:7-cyano-7-deazaguanine synthase
MCSIVGALIMRNHGHAESVNDILAAVWQRSVERGRDGRGFASMQTGHYGHRHELKKNVTRYEHAPPSVPAMLSSATTLTLVGNHRAEPTTEYVKDKVETDQQPYMRNGWNVVHNGTIANDKELRDHTVPTAIDSAAIAEVLADLPPKLADFSGAVRRLKGSFAILAYHDSQPDTMFVACNYRPVWYAQTEDGFYFASSRQSFPPRLNPTMMAPYTISAFHNDGTILSMPLRRDLGTAEHPMTALVVCSGGLDSVVSAAAMKAEGYDLHLIHFQYGSRAEGPEVKAVKQVAEALGAKLTLFPLAVYDKSDSPLLDPDSKVAGGEAGAEFAHEWVPARNTVLLAVATAFAEARGYEVIVLGNNLEEAGAYPDNEPEFIARFNDLLPFAVGDGKRMRVEMPVGNLMKHEIVKLGHEIDAPMDMTWSCYRAGALHCGTCGPCYMRRKAFAINGLPEVLRYADEQEAHV